MHVKSNQNSVIVKLGKNGIYLYGTDKHRQQTLLH